MTRRVADRADDPDALIDVAAVELLEWGWLADCTRGVIVRTTDAGDVLEAVQITTRRWRWRIARAGAAGGGAGTGGRAGGNPSTPASARRSVRGTAAQSHAE